MGPADTIRRSESRGWVMMVKSFNKNVMVSRDLLRFYGKSFLAVTSGKICSIAGNVECNEYWVSYAVTHVERGSWGRYWARRYLLQKPKI